MAEILDLTEVAQSVKEYEKIIRGQMSNEIMARYYEDMATFSYDDKQAHKFINKAANLRSCHKIMFFHHYEQHGIKDYQRTLYCHDKFCPLCQKLKANTREQKFQQILSLFEDKYDFYHMVLTLKNSRGSTAPFQSVDYSLPTLFSVVKAMPKCFQKLIKYLSGNTKIAGLDFSEYGYAGAVRTLEVTFKEHQEYHAHYHGLFAMSKDLVLKGHTKNAFSKDKFTGKETTFTDFEILLQKIWYLVMNEQKVTVNSIEKLKLGYSCYFKKVLPKESHDVFKYIIKPDKNATFTGAVFQDLYLSLKGMRAFQTFGCFHGLQLEDEVIDDSNAAVYDKLINSLNHSERPVDCSESPTAVRDNIAAKKFVYISRRSVRAFIQKMGYDDDFVIAADPIKMQELVQMVMPDVLTKKAGSFLYLDGGRNILPKKKNEICKPSEVLLTLDPNIDEIF